MADVDPYDVGELGQAVNESAQGLSTLWVTFLVFGGYLAATAAKVTQHDLLSVEGAVTIPTVDIAVPLVASFIILPIAFVVFHVYLLVQVVLLARTAAAYNEAVERTFQTESDKAGIRQRLANTLFAQVLAGTPRERGGAIGLLLRLVAWVTLAIAPVLVLILFQLMFLAYQSAPITWLHRGLIAVDLASVLMLWRAAIRPGDDVAIPNPRTQWPGIIASLAALAVSWVVLSFPGEPQAGWTRHAPHAGTDANLATICGISRLESLLPASFDRLTLPREHVIDPATLERIEQIKQPASMGESTRDLHGRSLRCAVLTLADMRHVDLSYADLTGAILALAQLQGAVLSHALVQQAKLYHAHIEEASSAFARFDKANLWQAKLQGADLRSTSFDRADLLGADLHETILTEATFRGAGLRETSFQKARMAHATFADADLHDADMSGGNATDADFRGALLISARLTQAHFTNADLRGARLDGANLEGADLANAKLQGAVLNSAHMRAINLQRADLRGASLLRVLADGALMSDVMAQGADMGWARLNGADLDHAQLQGVDLDQAELASANVFFAYLWRTNVLDCSEARVVSPQLDAVLDYAKPDAKLPEAIDAMIAEVMNDIPEGVDVDGKDRRKVVEQRMRGRFRVGEDEAAEWANTWKGCERPLGDEYNAQLTDFLINLACQGGVDVGYGIYFHVGSLPPSVTVDRNRIDETLVPASGEPCPKLKGLKELIQPIQPKAEKAAAPG